VNLVKQRGSRKPRRGSCVRRKVNEFLPGWGGPFLGQEREEFHFCRRREELRSPGRLREGVNEKKK